MPGYQEVGREVAGQQWPRINHNKMQIQSYLTNAEALYNMSRQRLVQEDV